MGYEYAYNVSGMNKVLQAAGRVIRSETDKRHDSVDCMSGIHSKAIPAAVSS